MDSSSTCIALLELPSKQSQVNKYKLKMRRKIKLTALALLRNAGVFRLVANSSWRRQRLLILCYHGISLEDEHLWRPQLYVPAEVLQKRLEMLRTMDCSVLPLQEGLARL